MVAYTRRLIYAHIPWIENLYDTVFYYITISIARNFMHLHISREAAALFEI